MSTAGISFGGLASGLDTKAIISALVAVERNPILQLQKKESDLKQLMSILDGSSFTGSVMKWGFKLIGAVPYLRRNFPGSRVGASAHAADVLQKPRAIDLIRSFNAEYEQQMADELAGEDTSFDAVTVDLPLKEGDRMLTVLRGVDANAPEDIQIGAPVRVEFEAANEDTHIPFWRVVEG